MKTNKINCFLIGAQKAGTTTLYSWLSQHPEIDAPEAIKDFHFFTSDEYFPKGTKWFESLYKNENTPVRINGAVNYILRPEAPQRINTYNADAKFILVLRDPVKRAYSAYQFFKKLNREKHSFQEAIKREKSGALTNWNEKDDFAYVEHGLYFEQIEHWFTYFEKDKFLILIYEELFKDPEVYLPEIFNFLNVKSDFMPELKTKNVSGEVKYKWLNKLIYDEKSILKQFVNKTGAKKLVPLEWRGSFLNKFRDINTKNNSVSGKISQQEYEQLCPLFNKDIQNLSKLLNKDLKKVWKY